MTPIRRRPCHIMVHVDYSPKLPDLHSSLSAAAAYDTNNDITSNKAVRNRVERQSHWTYAFGYSLVVLSAFRRAFVQLCSR